MISPNKQNLLFLKKQKKLVANGLKLLTEKRNSLIAIFLDLSAKGKQKQKIVSNIWSIFFKKYNQDLSLINVPKLLKNIFPPLKSKTKISTKRFSGVYLDQIELAVEDGQRQNLKPSINSSLTTFKDIFPEFIQLAQTKSNCLKISREIIRTNRQISNLENKSIEIDSQIKYIENALLEKSNAEKAILIKIFS